MSKFLGHIACPRCGSKDNLGEYEDHWFCFGCKYTKRKDDVQSLRKRLNKGNATAKEVEMLDNFAEIPRKAMQWLLSYGISQEEIDEYGIKWNPTQQLLVLIEGLKYWQGRSFSEHTKQKYMSQGKKPDTIYGMGDTLVLVEDVLSAIKIARLRDEYCAMPVLGSTLSFESEQSLSKQFKTIYVWLDRDKALNALRIKRRLHQKGITSRIIVTELDPKVYSKEQLKEYLDSN